MSFSTRILVWLVGGVSTGLLLGDLVAPLNVVASGFVKLLQMTVLPYVVISIIASLGSLSAAEARRLGVRAGLVLVALWSLALLFALLMPLAFPTLRQGSFFSTSMLQRSAGFDFVDLYIPSNPFNSLANNVVPAVVLFSIMLGVALIGLRSTRDSLLTAFVAGDLFIVLPALTDACKALLERHVPAREGEHASALPDVIVPASFNFPHTGKLLSLSFVLFAGWFANVAIPYTSYPALALTGLLTFFGSLSAAVPFLLDVFRIPADTFQLFLATGVINQRFGSRLAAVHTVVVGVLGSAAIAGAVRFDARRVTRCVVISLCLVVGLLSGLRILFATARRPSFDGGAVVSALKPVLARAPVVDGNIGTPRAEGSQVLDSVRATGAVRVCYVADRPPYAFTNRDRELAGLDVEMAHQLAIDLQARLQLAPVTVADFAGALDDGAATWRWAGWSPLR